MRLESFKTKKNTHIVLKVLHTMLLISTAATSDTYASELKIFHASSMVHEELRSSNSLELVSKSNRSTTTMSFKKNIDYTKDWILLLEKEEAQLKNQPKQSGYNLTTYLAKSFGKRGNRLRLSLGISRSKEYVITNGSALSNTYSYKKIDFVAWIARLSIKSHFLSYSISMDSATNIDNSGSLIYKSKSKLSNQISLNLGRKKFIYGLFYKNVTEKLLGKQKLLRLASSYGAHLGVRF